MREEKMFKNQFLVKTLHIIVCSTTVRVSLYYKRSLSENKRYSLQVNVYPDQILIHLITSTPLV